MKKSILAPGVKDYFHIAEKFVVDVVDNSVSFLPAKKY
jgi:hypothetical protein